MKAVVLLSAGLDSTVNLYLAREKYEIARALTCDYGQRAAPREIETAERICRSLNIPHQVLSLPWVKEWGGSALLDTSRSVPRGSEVRIHDQGTSDETAERVWVPNRNGILLNIAAGVAESLGAGRVIPGFNAEEAKTFPDNSADFMEAVNKSFSYSTRNRVQVECLTVAMHKPEIFAVALKKEIPLQSFWPCYFADPKPCGECESCQRFLHAAEKNGREEDVLRLWSVSNEASRRQ